MPKSYAWGKFFQAVTALVYEGDLRARLAVAAGHLAEIDPERTGMNDPQWTGRFMRLRAAIAGGDLRIVGTERAEWLAEEVLSLFVDVDARWAEERYFRQMVDGELKGGNNAPPE